MQGERDLTSVNSFEDPSRIRPEESTITVKGKSLTMNLAPYSLTVIRVKTNNMITD